MNRFFSSLPKIIRKRFLIQACLGLGLIVLFIVLLACVHDIILALPCMLLAVYLCVNAFALVYAQARGNIICVHCKCAKLERSALRKRNKAVYLDSERGMIKVIASKIPKRIAVGESLDLYLKKSARVYERGNEYTVSEYIALVRPDAN